MDKSDVTSRLEAYAMLTHHALNTLYKEGACCYRCCAACSAIQYLDEQGILDAVIRNWEFLSDGERIPYHTNWCGWWRNGQVDRDWLYQQWDGPKTCHGGT